MHSSFLKLTVGCVALTLAGCAVGPNYQRPAINAPVGFRDATNQVSTNSFADLPWWSVFKDPVLQDLVHVVLTNNYDLRITLTRVDQARALQAQTRSQFLPQVDYRGDATRGRNSSGRLLRMAAGRWIVFWAASKPCGKLTFGAASAG